MGCSPPSGPAPTQGGGVFSRGYRISDSFTSRLGCSPDPQGAIGTDFSMTNPADRAATPVSG